MNPKTLCGSITRDHQRDLEAHRRVIVSRCCSLCCRAIPIEAVSRALRHRTTKTTEAFYARIRAADAFREIDRIFERPPVEIGPT